MEEMWFTQILIRLILLNKSQNKFWINELNVYKVKNALSKQNLVKINEEVNESEVVDETERISLHEDYIENIRVLLQKWEEEFKFKDPNIHSDYLSYSIILKFN